MITDTKGSVIVSHARVDQPRLSLGPKRQALLAGAWWPRSTDPAAELPGLVVAIGERYDAVNSLMLCVGEWDFRPHRLVIGDQVVSVAWYSSQPDGLLIACTENTDRVDLLVVPARTEEHTARAAMSVAADPDNTLTTPRILAAMPRYGDSQPDNAIPDWESEGGAAL